MKICEESQSIYGYGGEQSSQAGDMDIISNFEHNSGIYVYEQKKKEQRKNSFNHYNVID
jgi:hypothetical protein